ncbi:hypothetical protein, partial [Salinispora arenicola]|uniref:hypothetical protein n=1 Tax=Salinispora arenicola TaxID=168697 RepID=UPI001E4C0EBE
VGLRCGTHLCRVLLGDGHVLHRSNAVGLRCGRTMADLQDGKPSKAFTDPRGRSPLRLPADDSDAKC